MGFAIVVAGSGRVCNELCRSLRKVTGVTVRCDANYANAGESVQPGARCAFLVVAPESDSDRALRYIESLRQAQPARPRILLVERSSEQLAVAALRAGAHEYLAWPIPIESVMAACRRCAGAVEAAVKAAPTEGGRIVGRSSALKSALSRLHRLAGTDCPVLITGETGTGKELAAQLLHSESPRAAQPLVTLNCAAIPDTLLESELFGYERGAFTGAHERRNGALADANHGTVMLDEIGDMDPVAQAKILRAVETRTIQRLGSSRPVPVDVRIVACTHHDLRERVAQGLFRRDLYYRLHVAEVHMPTLRDRPEDIAPIAENTVESLWSKYPGPKRAIRRDLLRLMQEYRWPGNVRELKNLLESIYLFAEGPELTPADVPAEYQELLGASEPSSEREKLLLVLRSVEGNKALAARKLHCSRMTLYRKLAKHELLDAADRRRLAGA